jgi:ABC-type nickel/cobalt efflux system permease component RcnA
MKSVLTALRPLRALLVVCFATLVLFSTVSPSFAAAMKNEPNPSTNKAAKEYEQVSRDALETGHPGPNLKESQEKTKGGGLNEVQGKAGLEEMNRPSNSGGVPTVEEKIQDALESAKNVIK